MAAFKAARPNYKIAAGDEIALAEVDRLTILKPDQRRLFWSRDRMKCESRVVPGKSRGQPDGRHEAAVAPLLADRRMPPENSIHQISDDQIATVRAAWFEVEGKWRNLRVGDELQLNWPELRHQQRQWARPGSMRG